MKYIHSRKQYHKLNRINEIIDSDNLDVDFSDTLIGGTLNRLLGFVRSNISDANMKKYVSQLDRTLASIVVQPTLDEINTNKGEGEEISLDELSDDGQKVQSSILYLDAAKKLADGKEEEATDILKEIPEEILKGLPEAEKITAMTLYKEEDKEDEEDEEESGYKEGDIVLYNKNEVQISSIDSDSGVVKVKNKDGKEKEVNIKELEDKENEEENKNDLKNPEGEKIIKKYKEEITYIEKECVECIKNKEKIEKVKKLLQTAKNKLNEITTILKKTNQIDPDGGLIESLEVNMDILRKICDACKNGGESKKVDEKLNIILEKAEAINVLTNKEFDKIKKELDKKSKEWKISPEDLKKLNKELSETKGIGEITGEDAKKIVNILTSAKNSLLHTKPYDQIRKKQQRYFDKLDSGRAISRKAYQTWVKNVTELVNYYKDKLPKKVTTLISDALDKEAISNDYVKINKEFLGVDKREKRGDIFKSSNINVGTDENQLKFIGVDELVLKKKLCFLMEITSDSGAGGFITGLIYNVNKNFFQFKFTRGINTKWLEGYYSGKNIETKITDSEKGNSDLNDAKIDKTNKYGEVFYGQAGVNSKNIKKGDHLPVRYLNFSELIGNNLTEVEKIQLVDEKTMNELEYSVSKWQVNKLGVLVGSKDSNASLFKTNSKNLDKRDGYFDPKLYDQITEILSDSEEENNNDEKEKDTKGKEVNYNALKEGDKIKYRKNDGTPNEGIVGDRTDKKNGMLRVVTDNKPEGFLINKDNIIEVYE